MSSLEQPVAVDYYKILGVPKNAHTKLICAQYIHFDTATVHLPSPITPRSNIKILMKRIVALQRLRKPSTCFMIVLNELRSREAEYL
jgi:hypothetical protein